MTVFIGTSGWQYKHWRNRFYPRSPRVKDELAYFSERFQTVEINASFYHLPQASTFENWATRVPDDFIFAVKASRYLTHIKRLQDPDEPVARLLERASRLGAKLGPVLLQLPPSLQQNAALLDQALASFPSTMRVAVEFRHESWFVPPVQEVLSARNAALCLADRGSQLVTPEWITANWGYMRFHWGMSTPESCYEATVLEARARLLARLWGQNADIFAYFNNDPHACALRDAYLFSEATIAAGLRPSRTPMSSEILLD